MADPASRAGLAGFLAGAPVSDLSPILCADGVRRCFGDRAVIDHMDLSVAPGERVGLHGPNGSGKTTALRCIAGTLEPHGGSIAINGHPAGSRRARELVGLSLSQERSFYLRLTGRENLLFFARCRGLGGRAAERRVAELEHELCIKHILEERASNCSTGMLQQMALARALLGSPSLLILDDPTRSLDDAAITRLWDALDRRSSAAVVIASHVVADLERCDRVIELPV